MERARLSGCYIYSSVCYCYSSRPYFLTYTYLLVFTQCLLHHCDNDPPVCSRFLTLSCYLCDFRFKDQAEHVHFKNLLIAPQGDAQVKEGRFSTLIEDGHTLSKCVVSLFNVMNNLNSSRSSCCSTRTHTYTTLKLPLFLIIHLTFPLYS